MLDLYPHYWIYYDMAAEDYDNGGGADDSDEEFEEGGEDVPADAGVDPGVVEDTYIDIETVDTEVLPTDSYVGVVSSTPISLTSIAQSGKAVTTGTHYWGKTKLNEWGWIEKKGLKKLPERPGWCGVGCFWDTDLGVWATRVKPPVKRAKIIGCMDSTAKNYNKSANSPCRSCCEYDKKPPKNIIGCMDPTALNYNEKANVGCEDCCVYKKTHLIPGCMDRAALNFCSQCNLHIADVCVYESKEDVPGCMDVDATNYNSLANVDDGSCVYITTPPPPLPTIPTIPPELIPDKKKIFCVNIFKSPDGNVTEKDIPVDGDIRKIEVAGTPGSTFSLDITKSDGCSILTDTINNAIIPGEGIFGKYTFIQRFPATTKEETYEINLTPSADVQLAKCVPITTPTYSLAQYAGSVVTFTNTATINITIPTATTLKGLVNKPAGNISTSSTSTGVSESDYGDVSISWTIERSGETEGYLYVKKQPSIDDWSDDVSIIRTVLDEQDSDHIKIEPHTIDIESGMSFTGEKTIKKIVFACEDCTDCDKSNSSLKLDSIDGLEVGMTITSDYVKNSTFITEVDEGCKKITISSKEIIKPSSILTFTKLYAGSVVEVLNHKHIKIDSVTKFIGGVKLTFNDVYTTTLSNISLSSTSGTISPVISGKITVQKFGKKNITFTQDLDNILTYTPNAYDQTVQVVEDTLKEIDVLALDKDENYRVKTPSIVTNPTRGSLSGSDFAAGIGTIDYTPTTGLIGNDSFTFKVNDGTTDSDTKTVYITVK